MKLFCARRTNARLALCLLISIVLVVYFYSSLTREAIIETELDIAQSLMTTSSSVSKPTLILLWNEIWPELQWDTFFTECSHDCVGTTDRSVISRSSAILFFIPMLEPPSDFPRIRYHNQYYVFLNNESPVEFLPPAAGLINDVFNLTMTYRRDSDIVLPYGDFRKAPSGRMESTVAPNELLRVVEGKKKLAAIIISHCGPSPSKRAEVVGKMQQLIPIDIIGKCGKLQCPEPRIDFLMNGWNPGLHDASPCHKILTRDYKFYLAFENSICPDYVTEKFFSTLDNTLTIPVVLERRIVMDMANRIMDSETAAVLNSTFIAADDFPDVQSLVAYMKYLNKNVTAYLDYFRWRQGYEILLGRMRKAGCELCKVVTEGRYKPGMDIGKWYYGEFGDLCRASVLADL